MFPGAAHLLLDEAGTQLQFCIQAIPFFPQLLQLKAHIHSRWGWGAAETGKRNRVREIPQLPAPYAPSRLSPTVLGPSSPTTNPVLETSPLLAQLSKGQFSSHQAWVRKGREEWIDECGLEERGDGVVKEKEMHGLMRRQEEKYKMRELAGQGRGTSDSRTTHPEWCGPCGRHSWLGC